MGRHLGCIYAHKLNCHSAGKDGTKLASKLPARVQLGECECCTQNRMSQ